MRSLFARAARSSVACAVMRACLDPATAAWLRFLRIPASSQQLAGSAPPLFFQTSLVGLRARSRVGSAVVERGHSLRDSAMGRDVPFVETDMAHRWQIAGNI